MQTQIVLRNITSATVDILHLPEITRDYCYSSADTIAITFYTDRLNQNRIVSVASVVPQQLRSAVEIIDDYVDIAIVIDVAKGSSTTSSLLGKWCTKLSAYFGKRSVTVVMMHEIALLVGRQLRINVTVDDQQIHPTIVVIVKEFRQQCLLHKKHP